jgi:hypothetical protein
MDDIGFSASDSTISCLTKLAMTWTVEILPAIYTLFINRCYSFYSENVYLYIKKKNSYTLTASDMIFKKCA